MIFGPPRSGTSVVSHLIHKFGVDFGYHDRFVDPQVHIFNPIFFELRSLNELNDEIFLHFSKNYHDFDWLPEESNFCDATIRKFQKNITSFVEDEFASSNLIGLKDPRFCFTLPIWNKVLKSIGYNVYFVLTHRLSNAVFYSNKIENSLSSATNFRLVVQSTLLSRYFVKRERHIVVSYESLLADKIAVTSRICNKIGLDNSLINKASAVICDDLNHHKGKQLSLVYNYFKSVIDAECVPEDEYIRYREIYSTATIEKDRTISGLNQSLSERESQIDFLRSSLSERDKHICDLKATLEYSQIQKENLNHALNERAGNIASLQQLVAAYQGSTSWRITKPLRIIGQITRRTLNILKHIYIMFSNLKELNSIAIKSKRKGFDYIENQIKLLNSPEYAEQFMKYRGFSFEFLNTLIMVGTILIQMRRWWFANYFRKTCTERLLAYLRGETNTFRSTKIDHLRIHVDKPNRIFKIANRLFEISGWAVDLKNDRAAEVRIRIGKVQYQPSVVQREDVQRAFASISKLPSDVGFSCVPVFSIGMHRIWIDIKNTNKNWVPVSRGLLLIIPQLTRVNKKHNITYRAWCRNEKKRLKAELPEIKQHIEIMLHLPKFTIVVDTRESAIAIEKTLQSIREQVYSHYELIALVGGDAPFTVLKTEDIRNINNFNIEDMSGEFVILMKCGQSLSINALYEFANVVNQYPDIDLIYGDEDHLSENGERYNPFYKPDWSPDYLETFNYIGFPACFRTVLLQDCVDKGILYDIVLRFTERTNKIWHVRKIIGHNEKTPNEKEIKEKSISDDITALYGRLCRTGRLGTVRKHAFHFGCYDIEIRLKREPLVSIVIPTAGKTAIVGERRIDLIENVIKQIREKSKYKNIEIIVVDNGDLSNAQKKLIAKQDCKRVSFAEPELNIPKKLNLGASIAEGEFLLLMNDDIEILTYTWIERMLEHFEKPHVGVVGVKLLYPNLRIQHVGVVHNYGNPDHVRRGFPRDEAGYYFSTCGVRNYMAVTGAVMMTSSRVYHQVGGYSETLRVSFNDIDYCQKLQEKGYYIVYTPKVELIHMESQSRSVLADLNEVEWYHKRWASKIVDDRYYNEQFLTVAPPTFITCVNKRLL